MDLPVKLNRISLTGLSVRSLLRYCYSVFFCMRGPDSCPAGMTAVS